MGGNIGRMPFRERDDEGVDPYEGLGVMGCGLRV